MRRTRSAPIQFRLLLDDYAVLEELAAEAGQSPKDFVIGLTLKSVAAARRKRPKTAATSPAPAEPKSRSR